ncbi:MAG: hypothetical protein FRX48_05644 [Lasallia pustulata]|uniref:OTT_1508-like deaminase n=1 Tax=Lasallia pustulata TaxID=136370 RepID=A0A5M8PMM6_9LECA|nr:MAG: hypothetical protein FRX48_05644 [Lasallia pustulata]
MRSVQTAPGGRSIWHAVKQDTFMTNSWQSPQVADRALNYVLPFGVEHQFVDDLAFLAAAQAGAEAVSAATINEDIGGHKCTVKLAANEGVPAAVASALNGFLGKLQERARKEISYNDCEERLFETAIRLSRKRIYARLRSKKWKKPSYMRAAEKEPLTEKLLASSKRVLAASTTRENKKRLQDIADKIKKLHELYLEMERTTGDDTDLLKQILRQASGLSAPAPSLEKCLIANGVSGIIASSNLIRRVDKLGRYWAACSIMARLASNAKYRNLFTSIQLETVPSYKAHIWPPGSKKKRHVHAEVQLVTHSRLHPSDLPPRVIGISKAACYLCDLFLSHHKQFYFSGSHGTIFDAWTVPDLLEYSMSDVTELRQIMVAMNRKVLETGRRMKKPRAKREAAPKQFAYQSFIWSNPYQASTPPLSTRDDHSPAVSPRPIIVGPTGAGARTPPSFTQLSLDEGGSIDNIPMRFAQEESQNQATIAHSSHETIGPPTYAHTVVHDDSDGQGIVAEDRPAPVPPLPEGESDSAAAARPIQGLIDLATTGSDANAVAQNSHIDVPEPRDSRLQLPHEHNYAAAPSEDHGAPSADASAIHSLPSSPVSSSSEILLSSTHSPISKILIPRRPLFASLHGIDLYFSLEASPTLDVLPRPITQATVAIAEMPSSALLPLDVRSTHIDVAAMAPGEELVLEAPTDGAGGGPVEMHLRNREGDGSGARVVCEWRR